MTRAWPMDERPRADAMATDRPGILLGIVTADCAPVLFADLDAGVVGAAHAGWRGALGGVTDSTIAAMERLGARRDRIHAAVGPCIGQPSYEVDEDFRDALPRRRSRQCALLRRPAQKAGRISTSRTMSSTAWLLPASTRSRRSTSTHMPTRTASSAIRRATHRGEPDYGRQLSAIALPG